MAKRELPVTASQSKYQIYSNYILRLMEAEYKLR
jgi:hypothetical protein